MEVIQLQDRAGRLIDLFQLVGDGQSGIEGGLDRPERPKDEIFMVRFGNLNVGRDGPEETRRRRYGAAPG